MRTELTDIPGIGDRTAKKLLREFGSVAAVRAAGYEAWREIAGRRVADGLREKYGEGRPDDPV